MITIKLLKIIVGQVAIFSLPIGYYSIHTYFHDQVKEFIAFHRPDGVREENSERLRDLVKTVYMDARDKLGKSEFKGANKILGEAPTNPLKFFSSATLEPITFGDASMKTGTLIGLPNHYNYESADQLPDSLFQIDYKKFLRSPQDAERERNYSEELEKSLGTGTKTRRVTKIDRDSPEGMDYANSLSLSDKAKKFSIARELFLSDIHRPLANIGLIVVSIAMTGSLGYGLVLLTKSAKAHVIRRISCYSVAMLTGGGCTYFTAPLLLSTQARQADKRAIKLGPEYEEGAEEYFSKRAFRDHCLGIKR